MEYRQARHRRREGGRKGSEEGSRGEQYVMGCVTVQATRKGTRLKLEKSMSAPSQFEKQHEDQEDRPRRTFKRKGSACSCSSVGCVEHRRNNTSGFRERNEGGTGDGAASRTRTTFLPHFRVGSVRSKSPCRVYALACVSRKMYHCRRIIVVSQVQYRHNNNEGRQTGKMQGTYPELQRQHPPCSFSRP